MESSEPVAADAAPTVAPTPELADLAAQAQLLESGQLAAPEPANGPQPNDPPTVELPMMEARLAVGGALALLSGLVQKKTGVKVELATPSNIEEGAERWAPVLAKYGAGLPAWLKPYELELKAGIWTAGVLFGLYVEVTAELERRATAATNERKGEPAAPAGA